ncbi:putative cleavage and polyadenylation specificity factor subunit 4-like protein isoform X2 [Protopterus annectens]|uniref:putative cleavage and polyadenylation specificity factor subunit 4-like protein isoform X2 n=1 Tax=Protopterus annectens TaxID=7888 RepID=UPI001CF9742A|nr:putative cleavage and polyadenylation specificity factor subunit 4-like protein isoform X2 [Protopterus annectens]
MKRRREKAENPVCCSFPRLAYSKVLELVGMQELVAGVEKLTFDLERDVATQRGAMPLPFVGMDKSGAAVCEFFPLGICKNGPLCPFRHVTGEKTIVCKHWLRGLCKKGDHCEFLHEYDMTKMPECYFYSKYGPLCKHKHTRRVMCTNYLVGFCHEGPNCKFVHPKLDLPQSYVEQLKNGKTHGLRDVEYMKSSHAQMSIPSAPPSIMDDMVPFPRSQPLLLLHGMPQFNQLSAMSLMHYQLRNIQEVMAASARCGIRPLEQVTCFKCGDKGHYANKCGKKHVGVLVE